MVSLVVLDLCLAILYAYSQRVYIKSSFYSRFSGGGGGSGGSISLSACTIDAGSSSLVQAKGGAGGKSHTSQCNTCAMCGGGGGGGGIIQTEMANTVGTLVLQVDGGAPPSDGRNPGVAGSIGKVFLVSSQTLILDCRAISLESYH